MRLSNCGPAVDESDVTAFERRVGIAVPPDYRRFLIEVNGGDGPPDESGFPTMRYFSLHWLGGAVSDADLAAYWADPEGWQDGLDVHRDLEFSMRGLWAAGLPRIWLPVARANDENLLLVRLSDYTVWKMFVVERFDEDRCSRVAASFGEMSLTRAGPGAADVTICGAIRGRESN